MIDGLNDLYRKDKARRNEIDYDENKVPNSKYTTKDQFKDNLKSAKLLIIVGIIFAFILGVTIRYNLKDNYIKKTYNRVEMTDVSMHNGVITGTIDGLQYKFQGQEQLFRKDYETLNVYYKDKIENGVILLFPYWYVISYVITIGGIILCICKIYHNLHVTSHAKGASHTGKYGD